MSLERYALLAEDSLQLRLMIFSDAGQSEEFFHKYSVEPDQSVIGYLKFEDSRAPDKIATDFANKNPGTSITNGIPLKNVPAPAYSILTYCHSMKPTISLLFINYFSGVRDIAIPKS